MRFMSPDPLRIISILSEMHPRGTESSAGNQTPTQHIRTYLEGGTVLTTHTYESLGEVLKELDNALELIRNPKDFLLGDPMEYVLDWAEGYVEGITDTDPSLSEEEAIMRARKAVVALQEGQSISSQDQELFESFLAAYTQQYADLSQPEED